MRPPATTPTPSFNPGHNTTPEHDEPAPRVETGSNGGPPAYFKPQPWGTLPANAFDPATTPLTSAESDALIEGIKLEIPLAFGEFERAVGGVEINYALAEADRERLVQSITSLVIDLATRGVGAGLARRAAAIPVDASTKAYRLALAGLDAGRNTATIGYIVEGGELARQLKEADPENSVGTFLNAQAIEYRKYLQQLGEGLDQKSDGELSVIYVVLSADNTSKADFQKPLEQVVAQYKTQVLDLGHWIGKSQLYRIDSGGGKYRYARADINYNASPAGPALSLVAFVRPEWEKAAVAKAGHVHEVDAETFEALTEGLLSMD